MGTLATEPRLAHVWPVPAIRSIHHVAVVTNDLAASERFYLDVLGLGLRARHHTDAGVHRATWVHLPDGTFLALEIGSSDRARDDAAPGLHCLALGIDAAERDAWREHLEASGHPVVRETAFTIYVRDPSGVLVGLSHHPATRASGVGRASSVG